MACNLSDSTFRCTTDPFLALDIDPGKVLIFGLIDQKAQADERGAQENFFEAGACGQEAPTRLFEERAKGPGCTNASTAIWFHPIDGAAYKYARSASDKLCGASARGRKELARVFGQGD
jgi:hypothetical protein